MFEVDCYKSLYPGRFPVYYRRAGVKCTARCKWRGYRIIRIVANYEQHVNVLEINDKIRGTNSSKPCPWCGGRVIHVYVTKGINNPRAEGDAITTA